MRKMTYLAVLEPGEDSYGVFFPDLPGCTSLGDTIAEAQENAQEALSLHIYGMEKDGDPIPEPSTTLSKDDTEGCFVVPVTIYPDVLRDEMRNKRISTNVTIPLWLKELAENKKINFSRLMETSLKDVLGVKKQ